MNFPLRKRPFPGARTARLGAALRGALLSFFAVASFLVMPSRAFAADGDDTKKAVDQHKAWVKALQSSAETLDRICNGKVEAAKKSLDAEVKQQIRTKIKTLTDNGAEDAAKPLKEQLDDTKASYVGKKTDAAVDDLRKDPLCTILCVDPEDAPAKTAEVTVPYCAFRDPVSANAAVIADLPSVRKLVARVDSYWRDLGADLDVDLLPFGHGQSKGAKATTKVLSEADVQALLEDALKGASGASGIDLATVTARTAEVALAALAKVIEDRAKRESLVWFLEEMHDQVCGEDPEPGSGKPQVCPEKDCSAALAEKTAACQKKADGDECQKATSKLAQCTIEPAQCVIRREIRTYWLPSTCALAGRRMEYAQMGGGARLLEALRGAVATDVRRWPGVAAGIGVGAAFWVDGDTDLALGDLFACRGKADEKPQRCAPALALRVATGKLVDDLMGGASASASFYSYGSAIDALNRDRSADPVKLHDNRFQIAACVMSIPEVFQQYRSSVAATDVNQSEVVEALLLGGMAGAPACWEIFGKGISLSKCDAKDTTCGKGLPETVLQAKKPLERLTTIQRLRQKIEGPAKAMAARATELEAAWKTFLASVAELKKAGGAAVPTLPPLDPAKINDAKTLAEVLEAFDKYTKDAARSAQQSQLVKVLRASSALAKASLDLGVTLTDGLAGLSDEALYPGLCQADSTDPKKCAALPKMAVMMSRTSEVLAKYSKLLGSVDSALTADWGGAVAQIVATVRTTVEARCQTDPKCKPLADKLSRYSGLFTALISETDPNKVAEALDAAAMPIGGWRQKQVPGTTMVSITSLAGLGLVSAEWRWGQYGVFKEAGNQTHVNPPVLQLPLGVDLTWAAHRGGASAGLFFSLIDPAAYLQYDADQQGRLPGAQLLTSLAPGLALRTSLWASPLVASVYGVFRPNFRAWDPAVTAPAAHVFQLGVGLSVDVTLFEIYTSHSE